jgi:excisionase family DNA binding protein
MSEKVRVEGAAVILGVSNRVVYRLAKEGRLTLIRDVVTNRTWIDREQVERLAAERLRSPG